MPDTIPAGTAPAEEPERRERPPGGGWTVKDVAARYRVSPDKVRAWIRHGELAALNTAEALCGKPRYVITPESLERFERGRVAATPPKPAARRKRRMAGVIDYYPD